MFRWTPILHGNTLWRQLTPPRDKMQMRGAMLLACERSGSAQRCIPRYRFKQRI